MTRIPAKASFPANSIIHRQPDFDREGAFNHPAIYMGRRTEGGKEYAEIMTTTSWGEQSFDKKWASAGEAFRQKMATKWLQIADQVGAGQVVGPAVPGDARRQFRMPKTSYVNAEHLILVEPEYLEKFCGDGGSCVILSQEFVNILQQRHEAIKNGALEGSGYPNW